MTNVVDPEVPPSGTGLRGVSSSRGLVATSTTLCGVWPMGCCDDSAQQACERACELVGSRCHPQLRAWRGLVLELPNNEIPRRSRSHPPLHPSRSTNPYLGQPTSPADCQAF